MKRILKRSLIALALVFVILNLIAFIHAYRFTHFTESQMERTKDPSSLSLFDKLSVLATGIDNPRPSHKQKPSSAFETFYVESTTKLECWKLEVPDPKGTIIMFHGYAGEKSSLLDRASLLRDMGFNTILVDFTGSGGSEGNITSIGYDEAQQVADCYRHLMKKAERNIILFGTSMGAVAILKAIHDDSSIQPPAIILECPFGSLKKTVEARFEMMGVPSFPMADLLTFWGGVQNGYWAYGHNPADYAKSVAVPTLVLYGELDERVSLAESMEITKNLAGPKKLVTYTDAGHNVFHGNQERWKLDVFEFLKGY